MPRVDIWIRKEDWVTWEKLDNKSEFVSRALNRPAHTIGAVFKAPTGTVPTHELRPIKTCKHGADPKFCKFAKPGKPCK